jgi:hypothetical protein
MHQFILRRVVSSKSLYLVLIVGLCFSFLHIYLDVLPLENNLSYGDGVQFTPYTKWIEFGGITTLISLLFLILPISSALPFADTFAKDRQTGYLRSILTKGKAKEYFIGLYITNFIVAGLIIAIPLLVNIYLTFMFLPNVNPDPIINNAMPIDFMSSLLPSLYYSHPLLHMLFYVFLAFLFSGLYATICLSVSFFINNRFVILASAFLVSMVYSLICQFSDNYDLIPSYFLQEVAIVQSFLSIVNIFGSAMLIFTLIFILGVRTRVVS